jgi:hypothetical protein
MNANAVKLEAVEKSYLMSTKFKGEETEVVDYRPNVHLDISAFLASTRPQGWRAALADLFRMGINHKILFGTDWPVFRNSAGHQKVMDRFAAPDGVVGGRAASTHLADVTQRHAPASGETACELGSVITKGRVR